MHDEPHDRCCECPMANEQGWPTSSCPSCDDKSFADWWATKLEFYVMTK